MSTLIQNLINQSPFIHEALDHDLINITSLARHLQPIVEAHLDHPVKVSAIVMAIKRRNHSQSMLLDKSLSRFMSKLGDVLIRSDIYDYTYAHSPTFRTNQINFLKKVQDEAHSYYSFCRGMNETTIVVNRSMTQWVEEAFQIETLLVKRAHLAAICITLPSANLDTSGVYYTLLKKLAWQGINIVEVISTSNEISLVVSKYDIDAVFTIVMNLKSAGSTVLMQKSM